MQVSHLTIEICARSVTRTAKTIFGITYSFEKKNLKKIGPHPVPMVVPAGGCGYSGGVQFKTSCNWYICDRKVTNSWKGRSMSVRWKCPAAFSKRAGIHPRIIVIGLVLNDRSLVHKAYQLVTLLVKLKYSKLDSTESDLEDFSSSQISFRFLFYIKKTHFVVVFLENLQSSYPALPLSSHLFPPETYAHIEC